MSGFVPETTPRPPRLRTDYTAVTGDRFAYWRDKLLVVNSYSGAVRIIGEDGSVEVLATTRAEAGRIIANF